MSITIDATIELATGLRANLPTTGSLGEAFFCTDTGELFVWNGSAQTKIGGSSTPGVQVAEIDLTSAQLLATDNNIAGNVPLQVIVAPSAGQAIIIVSALISSGTANTFSETNATILCYIEPPNTELAYFSGVTAPEGCLAANMITLFTLISAGFADNRQSVAGLPVGIICPCASGSVATTTLGSSGGTGYAPGDNGIIGGGDNEAEYVVDTVDGNGGVLTYHLDQNGDQYYSGTDLSTSVENGNGDGGLLITINSVTPGSGTVKLTIAYYIATL